MNAYRITLFGHRDFHSHQMVENELHEILRELTKTKPYVEIYIGRNGEFDVFSASVIKRAQKAFGKESISMTLVLPYVEKDIEYYEKYYDSVMIPECINGAHPKIAITKRNRWMVEKCDMFIGYIEHNNGGAYTALKYAEKLGKSIINLASDTRFDNK